MAIDLSQVSSPVIRLPRVLVVENNFSIVESLVHAFGDRRLDFTYDACTSQHIAVRKLLASPYQLIISGAPLAEIDDFLLLKHTQSLETFAPLVVTANRSDKESARRVLGLGAFDLISFPLEHEQAVGTIRLALWHSKLRTLITLKERALELYRQHLADYPDQQSLMEESLNRALAAVDKTITAVETSMLRFEESAVSFTDFARNVEFIARRRALERLDALPN